MVDRVIELCIAKNENAWQEFVRLFRGLVANSIRVKSSRHGFSFSKEDINDLSQKVFLDIWQKGKLNQIKDTRCVKGWLSMLAQNACVDFMRRDPGKNRLVSLFNSNDDEEKCFDIPADSDSRAILDNKDLRDTVDSFISSQPEKKRVVLSLALLQNLTHKEIAGILHISMATVSSIISRSKSRLRKILVRKGFSS